MATKHVLFYTSADDVLTKAPAHFPAHSARLGGVSPSVVRPPILWSADTLSVQPGD